MDLLERYLQAVGQHLATGTREDVLAELRVNLLAEMEVADQVGLDRTGNRDIQMDLMHSYGTNVPLYPEFQAFFRKYQPPTLIVWGKNDFIFPAEGAPPYQRDLKDVETHMLDTGHFALETHGEEIAGRIEEFLLSRLSR